MAEDRDSKRVRQACANCRRKKTKCSGERPICSFCARLGQTCVYAEDLSGLSSTSGTALQYENSGLAARVALLESRLSLLDPTGDSTDGAMFPDLGHWSASASGSSPPHPQPTFQTDSMRDIRLDSPIMDFAAVFEPNSGIFLALVDVYFRFSHAQPHLYFEESTFRRDLDRGVLPRYLLLAVAATAVRFSKEETFAGKQREYIDAFARNAWKEIVEQSFGEGDVLSVKTVQAVNMLGVVDYIAGRNQLAWVKIGLSIRFAQTLRLGREPPPTLSAVEAEERRHTFWSVYLLDRMVSCGRDRPPSLLDSDCTIALPTNPCSLRQVTTAYPPTLAALYDLPDTALLEKSDHFALTIFMVSALGHIVRWAYQHSAPERHLPWDARSQFSRMTGILFSFESYSETCSSSFTEVLDRHFVYHGTVDNILACHFVFSHVLYHVNQCLLHHPFLLRQKLRTVVAEVPPGFLRGAVFKSKEHADHLTTIMKVLEQRRCTSFPSFFGFAAIIAGGIHKLHSRFEYQLEQDDAEAQWISCLQFLDQGKERWESFSRMGKILREFDPSPTVANALLLPIMDPEALGAEMEEMLWQTCDYSSLTNATRTLPNALDSPPQTRQPPRKSIDSATIPQLIGTPDYETLLQGALSLDYSLLGYSETGHGG